MTKVRLTNNWIIIEDGSNVSLALKSVLTFRTKKKKIHTRSKTINIPEQINYAFVIQDGLMYIPIGLYALLNDYFTVDVEIEDDRQIQNEDINDTSGVITRIAEFENVLPGITLRPEQLMAVRKILFAKRGIINACTSFGKTEVMSAAIKILTSINWSGMCPTVLIFEPTVKLVTDTVKRMKKYGIDAVDYSKNRKIILNKVNIAHPKSIGNDLQENPELLVGVEVLFGDETHHMASETYRVPTYEMPNLLYSIGVSASAISQEHINAKKIQDYSYEEILTIGATGQLLMNVTADMMIAKGALATPVLLRFNHEANEEMEENSQTDWHEVYKVKLQSNNRNFLVAKIARYFSNHGRKTLILVSTVEWARLLLKFFNALGLSDRVIASYGSGKFERMSSEDYQGNIINCSKEEDWFTKFDSGECNILIGTTHLYEGVSLSHLDVLILAFGGKAERLQVQGVGRVLRKTKTGKYAYLVDFTDDDDLILSKHSKLRLQRYKEIIGIPDDRIYDDLQIDALEDIFNKCEGIEN